MSNLADPLRQPVRFLQQADALMRQSFHGGSADAVSQVNSQLEDSFAHALEKAHAQEAPAPEPSPLAVHPAQALPIGAMDMGVAPYRGVLTGASGPVSAFGSGGSLGGYASSALTGIPSASPGAYHAGLASRPMGPELEGLIGEMSGKYQVPEWLVRNVIRQESGGNANATSPVGAQGLMQLMPGTARELGVQDAYDPRQNVEGGVKYLRQLLDMFHQDPTKAVAAYNAGPGAVQHYGGVPPFAETQNYVKRIVGP